MSIEYIQLTAEVLGDIVDEVTFVGGATMAFWISPRLGIEPRVTRDADFVVEVHTKAAYDRFSARLRKLAMHEDTASRVIGRWRLDESDAIVDVLPADTAILGYESYWLSRVASTAVRRELPNGKLVNTISPPLLVATKIEAFDARGRDDYLASRDFEDIAKLISGYEKLVDEIEASVEDVRLFVSDWLVTRMDDPYFLAGIEGALAIPNAHRFVEDHVRPRLGRLVGTDE